MGSSQTEKVSVMPIIVCLYLLALLIKAQTTSCTISDNNKLDEVPSAGSQPPCWCDAKQKHQTVYQLAKIQDNGALKFINLERFRKILKAEKIVGQRKIAIISIVGTYRSGKSTLLNILSRYLACSTTNVNLPNSTKTENWLYESVVASPFCRKWLFQTSSSQHVCTKGMWITAHPYILPNGIAVFLVDTQGLFDNHLNSSKTDSELFYAASLLSSTLIVNTKQTLDRGLTNLLGALTIRLRNSMAEIPSFTVANENVDGSQDINLGRYKIPGRLLQNLLFVIRDYHLAEKNPDLYLQKYFNPDTKGSLEEIKLGFRHIACSFLATISLNPENLQFTENGINNEFGKDCARLFRTHFRPTEIQPKTIFGKVLNGHEFAERLKMYEEIFGNMHHIPAVQDALEKELGFIGQEFTAILVNRYKKTIMQRLHSNKDVPEEEVRQLHFSTQEQLIRDLRQHEILVRKPKLLNEATKILHYETGEYLDRTIQARRFYRAIDQLKQNEQQMQAQMALQNTKHIQRAFHSDSKDDGSFLDVVMQPIIPFISLGAAFLFLYILYWIVACMQKLRPRKQSASHL